MEGHLMLRSILNPLSNNVRSLDFIFNHHFTNRALFGKKFDPLTNDYLIGFWLAVFSTTMLDNRDRIADGLFGTLGDNNGFKTLMVLPEKASDGKTLLLIQNFYFNSDRRRIKNGSLSSKERAKIHFLLGETYEEKIVHYLVYDIGQLVCSNRSDKIRPFMELLLDIVPGDDNNAPGDVEKFFKLEHFGNFFQNVEPTVQSLKLYGHNDENMQIITRLIRDEWKNGALNELITKLQAPSQFGFTHGFLFATYAWHLHDVKVHAFGRGEQCVSLTLQEKILKEDLRNFKPAASYNLTKCERKIARIEHFKEKIIQALNQGGNKTETGDQLTEYVHQLISFFATPSSKSKGKNYLRTYLRGMFMTTNTANEDHYIYSQNDYMQIALHARFASCLVIFNFDRNLPLNGESLNLNHFKDAIMTKCVWIVSIFEVETGCTNMLIDQEVKYEFNVTRFNFENFKTFIISRHKKRRLQTGLVRDLILNVNSRNEKSLHDIFDGFKHVMLAVLDVLKRDQSAFLQILEGLFHDRGSYFGEKPDKKRRIDIFRSTNVFCARIEEDGKITQVNFRTKNKLEEFFNRVKSGIYTNYQQVINFFYEYDSDTGNISLQMKVGTADESFNRTFCGKSASKEFKCQFIWLKTSERFRRRIIQPTYRFFMSIFSRLKSNNSTNANQSNALALRTMYSGVLLDDLSNPLYGLSDLISYSMQGYNNIDFVKSLKAMKVASKMAKITFMAVGSKIGVPIIGTVLSVSDTIAAWENYQNGDKSAFAIFNIVAGATSTIISIISLATGVLTLAGVAVTPVVGWILFAVGTAFYVIQNIWKVIDHFGGLKQFCIWSWEFTKSLPDIVQDPIKYLQSQKIEAADQIVSRALEILENNTKIQNVISTPICKQTIGHNYACQEIHIDFHQEVYIKKTEILPDRPKIIGKFAKKYKKLCPFHTAMGIIATYLTKDSSVYDYKCTNALAVGRITNGITHDPISLYMLHGNSSVHAIRDTVNIFQLSGGNRCSIRGGHRENTFIFSSAFQQCSIFGHEHSVNTADLSEIHSLNNYKIINGSMLEGVNSCTGQKSKIDMYYIGIVITEQHYNDSELEIVCSNISIVAKKQQEGLYFSRLYGIRVSNAQGCPYYLEITSHGSVNIDNQATNGKTVYTFPNVTGEVNMNLDNNRGTMTHSIMWKTISITEIRDVYIVVISLDLMIYQFGFTFKGYKTTLTLYNGTNSTQLMFADGLQLTFKDNSFVVEMLFPRSKGQLYDRYNQLFDNFRGAPLALNAYSDRDDELFVLTKNEIRFNQTTMPFSFFVTNYNQSIDEKVIKCKRGYNVILIKPSVSKATMQHILEKRAPWFDSFAIEMREEPDFLIIDFTAVLDSMVEHINNTLMEFALIQNIYKQQVTINVSAASWINKLKKNIQLVLLF